VLDDHLMMWGLDPAKDAVRLMPTTSWKGRWPQLDRDDEEDEQDAALAALAAQDAAEAAATFTATGDSASCSTGQGSQKQQPPVPAVTYISSPKPAVKPPPAHQQGLTGLLPEVLKLVAKVRRPFRAALAVATSCLFKLGASASCIMCSKLPSMIHQPRGDVHVNLPACLNLLIPAGAAGG
jgi:hypothetical protein